MNLEDLVREKRLVVCVGSGGVGKTSVAAAIGLHAARAGRRVLVLTIDPARRLADAMGLAAQGNDERVVPVANAAPGGELRALMLDTRSTFDDLIRRVSPDEETRERILNNAIYQIISDSFGSSQAYMSTEKLYDVWTTGAPTGRYDLVVLDTPPVKNALDFLDSPGRMTRFLDRHILKWFLRPYDEKKVFGKMLAGTSGVVFRLLGVVFGREFLTDLSAFFLAFRGLYDGFRERHEAVLDLFGASQTSFLVVCAPHEPSQEVADFFVEEFQRRNLSYGGIVVNMVHRASGTPLAVGPYLADLSGPLSRDLSAEVVPQLLAHLERAHERLRTVARAEAQVIRRLGALGLEGRVWVEVPRLPEPIRDLAGLDRLNRHLFPGPPDA